MILTNPFTGQVLNTWTDEARTAALESRRRKSGLRKSYSKLQSEVPKTPIVYHRTLPDYALTDSKSKLWGAVFPNESVEVYGHGGKMERELAAHEVGHIRSGHAGYDSEEMLDKQEREAWQWALKNRRKLSISKKKLRNLIRTAEAKAGLDRGSYL